MKGFFDYRLHDLAYANQSRLNSTQNALNSLVTVEALEKWFFVDARASITQVSRSAFDEAVTDGATASTNRTETTIVQISPYVRGNISDVAVYQLRFNAMGSRTSNGASPATEAAEWVGRVKNAPTSSRIGWALDGTSRSTRNDAIGKKENSRISGSLIYDIEPGLHAAVIYGSEWTDYASTTKQRSSTPGFGFEWSPSERTRIAGVKEKRSFGEGHSLFFGHRMPLAAWKYSDDKDATTIQGQIAAGGQGSAYGLMSDLLASSIADPIARAQAVRSRLEQTGVYSGSNLLSSGFATSRIFISRNREASVLLLGKSNTVTLRLNQTDRQSIGTALGPADSFSSSADIRQQNLSAAWSHRLSPLSSVTLVASRLHTEGLSVTSLVSRQHLQSLLFSTRLGPKTLASVGMRRAQFDSTVSGGYRENALAGTLFFRF